MSSIVHIVQELERKPVTLGEIVKKHGLHRNTVSSGLRYLHANGIAQYKEVHTGRSGPPERLWSLANRKEAA